MAKKIIIEKELLVKLYINEGKSIRKISSELGYTTFVIHTNLKDYNLNRDKSEAQKLKCKRDGVHNQFELDTDVLKDYHNKQKDKDNNRKKEIMEHLECRFIILNKNGDEILNTK